MAGTLSIVKSEDGAIFGGYTDIPWQNDGTGIESGISHLGNSFVFSVRRDGSVVKLKSVGGKEIGTLSNLALSFYNAFYISFDE